MGSDAKEMTEAEKPFQASWNLAESIIYNISSYITDGGNKFRNGQLDDYFWDYVLIKKRIYAFLNEEERESIDALEAQIKLILAAKGRIRHYPSAEYTTLLDLYDASIMELLHKYKLLVPPKEDRTRLIG